MSSVASRGGAASKNAGSNSNNKGKPSTNNKSSDSSSKPDKNDLNPKIQIKPTAEQMQIARIMDSHRSEEPELQKKIKQVMEITRTTEDQASMALHSRDYDVEQAITLLTEGGEQSLESEWACAGKKKKSKTTGQKTTENNAKDVIIIRTGKEGAGDRGINNNNTGRDNNSKNDRREGGRDSSRTDFKPEREKRDSESGRGESGGDFGSRSGGGDRDRGRGSNLRGRGGSRGGVGSGRGRFDKENDFGRSNGPGRGGPGGGRGGGGGGIGRGGRDSAPRTFTSRTRGSGRERSDDTGDSFGNTIDVWDPISQGGTTKPQTMKVEKWNGQDLPEIDDWEEYQGTLKDTKVFTPSLQQQQQQQSTPSTNGVIDPSKKISPQEQQQQQQQQHQSTVGNDSIVPGQNLDLSLILQKANNPSSAPSSNPANSQSAGATILATLQQSSSSYANTAASNHGGLGGVQQGQGGLPQRQKIQKPRVPSTKIPSSAVEMPDIASMSELDVQFGGLEFGGDSSSSLTFTSSAFAGLSQVKPGQQQQQDSSIISGLYSNAAAHAPGQTDSSRNFSSSKDSSSSHSIGNISNIGGTSNSAFPNQNQMTGLLQQQQQQQDSKSQQQQGGSGVSSLTSPNNIPIVDPHSQMSAMQQQNKNLQQQQQQTGSYNNPGSAFVAYKQNSSLPPGFPPQTQQTAASTYINPVNAYGQQQQQQQQPSYLSSYGGIQPIVSNAAPIVTQSQQQQNSSYGVPGNYGGGGSSNVNSNQYGSYQSKLSSNITSGNKNDSIESSTIPTSTSQITSNNLQSGPVISSSKSTALNTTTNVSSNTSSKMGTGINSSLSQQQIGVSSAGGMPQQPGMVMPQYILNQGGLPTYYSVQPPYYGMDESGAYMVPRLPPHMAGYSPYDANYGGNPSTGRTDANIGGFTATGADSRFPRSDSSTASPVPSNIQGQAGGTMYPGNYPGQMPGYYYVGNNMVHPYGPPPPHLYQTTAMAQTNPQTGHGTNANHQYQKGMYGGGSYATYDTTGQVGSGSDFSSGATSGTGVSTQSTDLNTSMYANKGQHMNKTYENKGYGQTTSNPYNSLGGNPLNNAPYGVYIAPVGVQTLQPTLHQQDGAQGGRGKGKQQGQQQQQYDGGPYWS